MPAMSIGVNCRTMPHQPTRRETRYVHFDESLVRKCPGDIIARRG